MAVAVLHATACWVSDTCHAPSTAASSSWAAALATSSATSALAYITSFCHPAGVPSMCVAMVLGVPAAVALGGYGLDASSHSVATPTLGRPYWYSLIGCLLAIRLIGAGLCAYACAVRARLVVPLRDLPDELKGLSAHQKAALDQMGRGEVRLDLT
jgi:hypothetical protein